MIGIRKGFKFVKRDQPIVTDTISFEDIEKETKEVENKESRKRSIVSPITSTSTIKKLKPSDDSVSTSIISSPSKNQLSVVAPKSPISNITSPQRMIKPSVIVPKSTEKEKLPSQPTSKGSENVSNSNKSRVIIHPSLVRPNKSPHSSRDSNLDRDDTKRSKILESIIPKSTNNNTGSKLLLPSSSSSSSSTSISGISNGEKNVGKRQSSSSFNQNTSFTKKGNKSYYPKIPYKLPGKLINSNKSQDEIFTQLIEDICKVEKVGLQEYFKTNKKPARKELETNLLDVLLLFQKEIDEADFTDITFQPEITSIERSIHDKLILRVAELEQLNEHVKEYDDNINLLGKDFNIWISDVPEKEILKVDGLISESTTEVMSRYKKLLEEIEKHCEAILKESDSVKLEISHAKKSQDSLYKTYTEMGSEGPDTKSMIKQYRQYL